MDRHLFEKQLLSSGVKYIAGVDEVGRGCLAGPVMAAAVILQLPCDIEGIKDSKKLTPRKRSELFDFIMAECVAVAFGLVSPEEIDKINILQATKRAMQMAVMNLSVKPDHLLIDGSQKIAVDIPQMLIPKGDDLSISVGAASIVAKVTRDRMMTDLEQKYPAFKFSAHKGYGTEQHYEELRANGPTDIHRLTFAGVV